MKTRVYLQKATAPVLQKNKKRPQKDHIVSHRGDRPKQKEKFFSLYTSSASECVWVNLPSRKVWAYQLWKLKSVQPKSKTRITMVLYKHILSLLQREVLEDLIHAHFLAYYFLTSLQNTFITALHRVQNSECGLDH